MHQSYACLYYHLVFSTKHRAPLITPDVQPRLFAYIGGILRTECDVLLAAGGMPDHVHLLAGLGRQASIADTMRVVKTNSFRWIHVTFPALCGFAWQTGYGAFTVSASQLDVVQNYLARQAEHHRKTTFQEEYLAFLKRHGIEFDARYLWD